MLGNLLNRFPERHEIDGITIPLQRLPVDRRTKRRIMRGGYETAERALVPLVIRSGDRVLEFGASLGIMTSIMAKRIGPDGKIIAVEPDGSLAADFHHQLSLNGLKAELVNALGCPLWSNEVPEKWRRMQFEGQGHTLSGRAVTNESLQESTTPWLTAENICTASAFEPNVLVIDIEGAETVWCEQAPHFPTHVERLMVEFHPHINGPEQAGKALQSLVAEGFSIIGFSRTVIALAR